MKMNIGKLSTKIKIELLPYNRLARVHTDITSLARIARFLSVPVKGARFTYSYKSGTWDGRMNFLNGNRTFLMGLLHDVYTFCDRKLNCKPKIIDNRESYIITRKIPKILGDHRLRKYQMEAVRNCINAKVGSTPFRRGIVCAATNAGKTLMAAALYDILDVPTLILCHKDEIMRQWLATFSEWFPNEKIGVYNRNQESLENVTVAMVQTLYARRNTNRARVILQHFKCLIVDEAQHAPSASWSSVIQLSSAYYRYALSGTALQSSKDQRMRLKGLFGKVLVKITNEELVDQEFSSKPEVYMVKYKNKDVDDSTTRKLRKKIQRYQVAIHLAKKENNFAATTAIDVSLRKIRLELYAREYGCGISKGKARANAISKLTQYHDGESILIFVVSKDHGACLWKKLREDGIDVYYINGDTPIEERNAFKNEFASGKIKVLITTMIWKEGIDIPLIDVLFMACAGKAPHTVLQIFGRGLRRSGKKKKIRVYDFYDRCSPNLKKHSKKRYRIYTKDSFEPIIKHWKKICV